MKTVPSAGQKVEMRTGQTKGRIVAETPANSNCFVGFHDIVPWSYDDSLLAIHRLPPDFSAMSDCGRRIEICLWLPQTDEILPVDSTTAWNFQQGSRLQWVPGRVNCIAFNEIERGRAVSVIRNIATGQRHVLPAPIYAVSPDGKMSIAPNFTTLAHAWKAYGYPPLTGQPRCTDDRLDGLWKLQLDSGEMSLFISTKRVTGLEPVSGSKEVVHFLCHPLFSPDGSKVAFLHRFFSADGGSFTRLIVTDREANDLQVLAREKVSHFDWLDNDTVLVWARFTGAGFAQVRSRGALKSPLMKPLVRVARGFKGRWKKKLLAEAYYSIPVRNAQARYRFGWPKLEEDGHPMVARSHDWIVTDCYADKNGILPLILYHAKRNDRVDVGRFRHRPRSMDSDVKCDLHPRWNRSENLIAVDTCESGMRQVRILDVHDILGD
ncbi:MAG TPA: hypothetical protein VFI20_11325 [Terracidiphilus sp.]|nr:hypothetical protein [Terracidiphilus sp.]